jgi:hypothetical protein
MRPDGLRRTTGHPSNQALCYLLSPLCPSPCDYKRERRATVTRVRPPTDRTPFSRDLGLTPSPDQLVTPTTCTPSSGTRQLNTGRRVLLLGGPNQSNPVVFCANHPSPTHDRYKFTADGREPRQSLTTSQTHRTHAKAQRGYRSNIIFLIVEVMEFAQLLASREVVHVKGGCNSITHELAHLAG